MRIADPLHKVGIGKLRIVTGGIYVLKDSLIQLPDAKAKDNRTKHEFRTVLVLPNQKLCDSYNCPCVLVAPLSTSLHIKAESDLIIQKTAENKLRSDSRAMLSYVQPVLKSDLKKHIGTLDDQQWDELMEQIVWNFDRQ